MDCDGLTDIGAGQDIHGGKISPEAEATLDQEPLWVYDHDAAAFARSGEAQPHDTIWFACRWSKDRDRQRNRQYSVDLARRALQVAADDAIVLGNAAHVFGYFEPDINPAIAPH
jgi:hypothetical protein